MKKKLLAFTLVFAMAAASVLSVSATEEAVAETVQTVEETGAEDGSADETDTGADSAEETDAEDGSAEETDAANNTAEETDAEETDAANDTAEETDAGDDFAEETEAVVKVSEDADIQAAYEAYLAMEAALGNMDYDAMTAAAEELSVLTENFSDAQVEEWNTVAEETVGIDNCLFTMFSVAMITDTLEKQEAFLEEKNAKTALDFVEAYTAISEADLSVSESVTAAYTEALEYMPSENVQLVYEAFAAVQDTLVFGNYEELQNSVENFYDYTDMFNDLSEDEMDEMAQLLGCDDGASAYVAVLNDWISANVIVELGGQYYAYCDNGDSETAADFVAYYESVFLSDEVADEALRAQVLEFFGDIEEGYADAKALLTETEAPETEAPETEAPETEAETKAPETEAETKAPETEAETKAPETEAETKAPEMEAETKATETEAETKAPETEAETKALETESETNTAAQTGDNTPVTAMTVLMLAAAAVLVELKRKRA